ncbi:cyclase family protein [Halopelagius longus]|uniref:Cyclase family protein n=1 Tax=Halopelagius longus TaxID=1236180 RepID=A0A1H1FEP2_9EURY|nr:cyclase family protein [Halopelagius longus]RDI70128.1 cyclase family protein [Halopelagius longus]SDQ99603.1 Kynurenine formamidase [Halopelagius longus]
MFPPEEIIDLSNPIENGMPVWPTFPPFELERTDWAARDGFTMERTEMRTHTGTHVDSPLHFVPEGRSLDDFPLSKFMGEGVAIDVTPKDPEEAITAEDIEAFEEDIEDGDVLMLHTGWDEYYGLTEEYLFEFPYLTAEAAQYCAELNLKAVGTEGASVGGWVDEVPAHGPSTDVGADESHLPLLENGVIPIEEVRNLDRVLKGAESRRAYFFFPPLNFRGTSGSPVRAFAFL